MTLPVFTPNELLVAADLATMVTALAQAQSDILARATTQNLSDAVAASTNAGNNMAHNPCFAIAQRGPGPWTLPAYTADRWYGYAAHTTGSSAFTQIQLADTDRTAIGDEAVRTALSAVVTGGTGATDSDATWQRIEGVYRTSGKPITVSFRARAGAGTPLIGVSIDQSFGTGGSPSATVQGTGIAIPITATWARYNVTLSVASAVGKVLGANGDDFGQVNFWFSAGASNTVRAGIGVQTANFVLTDVTIEAGGVASAPLRRDPMTELALCQRFYQTGPIAFFGYGATAGFVGQTLPLPVPMRAPPIIVPTVTLSNLTSPGYVSTRGTAIQVGGTVTATGAASISGTYTASADL